MDGRWFKGPTFLYQQQGYWPRRPQRPVNKDEVEELPIKWAGHIHQIRGPLNDLIQRQGNLHRTRRVIANIIRFIRNCRSPRHERKNGYFSVAEVNEAFIVCVNLTQRESYEVEISCLSSKKPLKVQSKILTLSPFLIEKGSVRTQGRLERAELPYEVKHPLILPSKHTLTNMVITEARERLHHGSVELTLCEIRQRFWIPKCRQSVKGVIHGCSLCKRLRSKIYTPFMAPLPTARLQPFQPPFSCVGIDYFGPVNDTIRRSQEKRHGCLFTCLSTRAVHIEIAFTLNTDSFLMAFRRFMDRRGTPSVVYSEIGTNLVAAEKELRKCLESWDQLKVHENVVRHGIQWHFSPPSAPHFGGV
ncbi:hypothetical protein M513_10923 [Trichuris suis]|uniref:Integrase zinc-binding domain-containing protein n=1 Tax=Trichuris suis TaxID=68888 RepID=A0A085LTB3_9BILA|nr:hypothetical protein M513_10923 [Trichuris suis]